MALDAGAGRRRRRRRGDLRRRPDDDDHHEHVRGQPRGRRRAHGRQPGDAGQRRPRRRVSADSTATASAVYSTFAGNLRGPTAFADAANGLTGVRAEPPSWPTPPRPASRMTAGPLRQRGLAGRPQLRRPATRRRPRGSVPSRPTAGPPSRFAPGPGSAAVDALAGAACPATDQRGLPRPAARRLRRRRRRGSAGRRWRRRLRCRARRPRRPAAISALSPEPVRLPRRPLGRQRRQGRPRPCSSARRSAPPCATASTAPPRSPSPSPSRPPGAARAGAASGRPPPSPAPSAACAPSAEGQLRPPGRRRPELLPLHRPPAPQGPRAGALQPRGQAAPPRHGALRAGHQGLPHRPLTARRRVLTSAVARGGPRGLPTR